MSPMKIVSLILFFLYKEKEESESPHKPDIFSFNEM